MDGLSIYQAVKDVGLGMALSVGIFLLCVWMVKHIITNMTKQLEKNTESLGEHTKSLNELHIRIEKADERHAEAHKFQKEEHLKMLLKADEQISILRSLNGKKA